MNRIRIMFLLSLHFISASLSIRISLNKSDRFYHNLYYLFEREYLEYTNGNSTIEQKISFRNKTVKEHLIDLEYSKNPRYLQSQFRSK